VTSREIGLKSYWFDRRLRLNLSAFDVDYSDMQVTYVSDVSNPAASLVLNAGEATIRGAELELLAQLTEDLTLTLDYAYLDAQIDKIDVIPGSIYDGAVNPASPYRVGDNIADLFIMPQTPDHSVSVAANYTVLRFERGDLNAHLEYRWQDRYEGSNANQGASVFPNAELAEYSAYGLVNARLTLTMELPRGESIRIGVWGKNILDEEYERFNIPFSSGAFPSDGGLYGNTIAWSEPAAYGIDLTYEF
jgi:iron complex outermembrane receptor protein